MTCQLAHEGPRQRRPAWCDWYGPRAAPDWSAPPALHTERRAVSVAAAAAGADARAEAGAGAAAGATAAAAGGLHAGALLANLGTCVARRGPEAAGGGVLRGGRLEPRGIWCGSPPTNTRLPHPTRPPPHPPHGPVCHRMGPDAHHHVWRRIADGTLRRVAGRQAAAGAGGPQERRRELPHAALLSARAAGRGGAGHALKRLGCHLPQQRVKGRSLPRPRREHHHRAVYE